MSVTVHHADNRDVLATLADNSIDAVVTDPPYALVSIQKRFGKPGAAPAKGDVYARASAGFMGKQWDTGEVAFAEEFWAQVWRVLKPGGHLVAFSGTRTYHRMVVAIEDAGFEIRDQLAWVYGCLSADTEILTASGWRLGVEVCEGELVAAWDAKAGSVSLEPVLEHTLAPYAGDLIRFVNDDTDQLLTPNHRVYHRSSERKMTAGKRVRTFPDAYAVSEAAELSRWNPTKLPCAGWHDGPGIGGADYAALLGWVWTEGGFDKAPSTGVRVYQSESANLAKAQEIEALFSRILPERKRYDRTRLYTHKGITRDSSETCWFFTGELAQRVRRDLPNKRPSWDLLWQMTQVEKLAFLDAAMKGDGSGDDFYQKDPDDLTWFQALLAVTGQRGKIVLRKAPRDGGSVCITPRETTELQRRHLVNATQSYRGDVWCVRVSTGAFLARRNGKVFVTGNSGFPKSHDVAKGIDKHLGFERAKVRVPVPKVGSMGVALGGDKVGNSRPWIDKARELGFHEAASPEAASPEAASWSGYGTALKPSWEPICLARKPLDGTVAENVLRWGVGALNIDGCRVGETVETWPKSRRNGAGDGATVRRGSGPAETVATAAAPPGRWPANIVHDGSDEVVGAFPERDGATSNSRSGVGGIAAEGLGPATQPAGRGDTGSAARFFYAAEPDDLCGLCGCPSEVFSGKLSPCNANTAEPSSPTENTQSAATAPCDAVGSQPPVREVKNQASSGLATDAELPSSRHRQAGSDTAAGPAATPGLSSLAQNVKSAGNLCGSCATAIAQSLAATRRGQDPELQPSPVSISERSAQILRQHLALYVEGRESTDTILTTPSLKQLLGSVFHAIAESTLTTEERPSASSEKSKRLWYGSKADATDRLGSKHPTIKPVDLMAWLVRMVCPPGGVVLDPFAGSGTTGLAAMREGRDCVLIEREEEYVADINRRIAWANGEGKLTAQELGKKQETVEALPLFGGKE